MGSTTILQLVGLTGSNIYTAISAPLTTYLNGYEVSGLTIDCNLPGSPNCLAGGISLNGQNILIRDVTVKNFGNNGLSNSYGIGIALSGADNGNAPSNGVIDSCTVYHPTPNITGVNTL